MIGTFESPAAYAAGHLFFIRGGNLMAQSFNEETLQLEGDPVPPSSAGQKLACPDFPDSRSPRTAHSYSCRRRQRNRS